MAEKQGNHQNELTVTVMEEIMTEAISALDRGKVKMFDVASTAREEYLRVRAELEEIKKRTKAVVEKVDQCERKYRVLRTRLMQVSSDFSRYSEEDIHHAYIDAQDAQMELAVNRERERELKQARSEAERRLIRINNLVAQAEDMVGSLTTALEILLSKLNGMAAQIEGYKTWSQLGNQIIQAQEEERRRIAREIHDGPAQAMANIVLRAEICEKTYLLGKGSLHEELLELKELVKDSLKEVRQIIFNLRPMSLDDLGLVPTLSQYIEEYKKDVDYQVELEVFGPEKRLPKSVEAAFFRLVQEALHNVRKHAQASRTVVRLYFQRDQVQVTISDDGVGFDLDEVLSREESHDHFGLVSMRERAELLHGSFELASVPGKGTQVTAVIPIPVGEKTSACY